MRIPGIGTLLTVASPRSPSVMEIAEPFEKGMPELLSRATKCERVSEKWAARRRALAKHLVKDAMKSRARVCWDDLSRSQRGAYIFSCDRSSS